MKKKGLIISTVVMVVVLIASLTTATYAWFSAQAQATVDDLAIKTEAATGLQLAMTQTEKSTAQIFSGDLTYTTGQWGGNEGWGTYLGFSSIDVGSISHATTPLKENDKVQIFVGYEKPAEGTTFSSTTDYYTATSKTVADNAPVLGLYVLEGNVYKPATGNAVAGATYYEIAVVPKPTSLLDSYLIVKTEEKQLTADDAGYYQPTGYNSKVQPIGYKKVSANEKGTYYYLTMAVSNLKTVGELGFSLEVVPGGDTNMATKTATVTNPGMAAASRINVSIAEQAPGATAVTEKGTAQLAPFSMYKLNTNTKVMSKSTAGTDDGASNETGCYTCKLGSSVTEGTVFYVTLTIWVEGKDNECNDITTGTNMQFNINFAYADTAGTPIPYTFTNITDVTTATAVTLTV